MALTYSVFQKAMAYPHIGRIVRKVHNLRTTTMFPNLGNVETQSISEVDGCKSQKLMMFNALLNPSAPGTFHLLPMTTRVFEKLQHIIDEEMQSVGAQKIILPHLSSAKPWKTSGRFKDIGTELFSFKDRHDQLHCLCPTHEEAVTSLVASGHMISYKNLPIKLYQIGRKYRDEMRPKNGLLRCREFEMKDLYSFDADEENARKTYEEVCEGYHSLFTRLGLKYIKIEGDVGNMGGSLSHEFQIVSDAGEDNIAICKQCQRGFNEELLGSEEVNSYKCERIDCPSDFIECKGIEIAHSFLLGTKYSKVFKAKYVDQNQKKQLLYMGCYGIGVTRLIAASIEALSSPTEIRWPRLIAPHQICIIPQKVGYKSDVTDKLSNNLHSKLCKFPNLKQEVVLDDRNQLSIGRRVYQAKQLGYPYCIAVGKKALLDQPLYELMDIYNGSVEFLEEAALLDRVQAIETIIL